jgi:hypothetical protein
MGLEKCNHSRIHPLRYECKGWPSMMSKVLIMFLGCLHVVCSQTLESIKQVIFWFLMGYDSWNMLMRHLHESMGTYHSFISPKIDVATKGCPFNRQWPSYSRTMTPFERDPLTCPKNVFCPLFRECPTEYFPCPAFGHFRCGHPNSTGGIIAAASPCSLVFDIHTWLRGFTSQLSVVSEKALLDRTWCCRRAQGPS